MNPDAPEPADRDPEPSFRNYVVRLSKGERQVAVAHDGNGFLVRLGDRIVSVRWSPLEFGRVLLRTGGETDEVRVVDLGDSAWRIDRGRGPSVLRVEDPVMAAGRKGHGHHGGPVEIRSPMPGTVLKILVEKGSEVVLEQSVLIIEAMKMQNELPAPVTGTVEEILVEPGAAVDGNQPLLRIRP